MVSKLQQLLVCIVLILIGGSSQAIEQVRIKDITNIRGFRENHVLGFGLVIGLKGTGDSKKSLSTNQAISNMLEKMGVTSDAESVVAGNVAAIIATAELPVFKRIGDKIDIKVSTVGDAKSLAGGTLLMTPLKAGDQQIYVVAQGGVVIGKADDTNAQVLTVAKVPQGGIVEREFTPTLENDGKVVLSLHQPDFSTNAMVAESINTHFKGYYAKSIDPATIEISVPPLFQPRLVEFIAELEKLKTDIDQKSLVVINERTGTIVMGQSILINPVSISHGDLSIKITDKKTQEESTQSVVTMQGTTIGDLVNTVNALGVTPADLISILQALKAAGALNAELKIL